VSKLIKYFTTIYVVIAEYKYKYLNEYLKNIMASKHCQTNWCNSCHWYWYEFLQSVKAVKELFRNEGSLMPCL